MRKMKTISPRLWLAVALTLAALPVPGGEFQPTV